MKNSPRLFKHFLAIFVVLAYLLTPGTVNGQTPEGWSRFDNDSEIQITSVAALTISDSGDIYAAGSFDTPAGVLPSAIARWNGETWVFLASAIEPEGHIVLTLAFSGESLYVGGSFRAVDGVDARSLALFHNDQWSAVGGGLFASSPSRSMTVHDIEPDSDGGVYVAGVFGITDLPDSFNIARWTGESWQAMGTGTSGIIVFDSRFEAVWSVLRTPSGIVYIGGEFSEVDGQQISKVAAWRDGTWNPLADGLDGGTVYALAYDGSRLYASGSFDRAGEIPASKLAVWDGMEWASIGGDLCFVPFYLAFFNNEIHTDVYTDCDLRGFPPRASWNGAEWRVAAASPETKTTAMIPRDDYLLMGLREETKAWDRDVGALGIFRPATSMGFEEEERTSIRSVFPNPSEYDLTVVLDYTGQGDTVLKISDLVGRTVLSQTVSNRAAVRLSPPVGLTPGIYFLSITGRISHEVYPIIRL
jgi:trimeric autotransporter adhesin